MIEVVSAHKEYKNGQTIINALDGVSLSIREGEFLSLAGPSGSGKTTLLNMIGCIDALTSGEISFEGQSVAHLSQKQLTNLRREKIGFIFQSFNLIPVLTAAENVAIALSLLGVKDSEANRRVNIALKEVGLAGMENRKPAELSGGQQQRVAIARALIKQPKVVLADEPTANLDSKNGKAILQLMRDLNESHKTTFVFSTHDQMVMECAQRLVYMHDGEIMSDKPQKGVL